MQLFTPSELKYLHETSDRLKEEEALRPQPLVNDAVKDAFHQLCLQTPFQAEDYKVTRPKHIVGQWRTWICRELYHTHQFSPRVICTLFGITENSIYAMGLRRGQANPKPEA